MSLSSFREDGSAHLVVGVDNSGSGESTKSLRYRIDREFAPGEFAEDAVGESDGRVKMSTRFTTNVDTEHDTETSFAVRDRNPHPDIF